MPRPARVDSDTIFEVLKELPIFHENGELKRRKDPVWNEAMRRIPNINLQNLYIFVHQNRRNIKSRLMEYMNIQPPFPVKPKVKKKEPADYDEIWEDHDVYDTFDDDSDSDALNDFEMLISIKNSDQYKDAIQKIGVIPFYVIYWHPQQISLWSDLINIEQSVSLIVVDSIISKVKGNFESGHIFLYALAVKLDNLIILLAEMMSDSINSLEIQYFLDTWLQGGAPAPPEFFTGYSYNLLDAASLSFNFCSFDQYNLRCFKYLMSESVELPPTLLQIDIISLIKVVNGWSCFNNIAQNVKDLFLCSIMYLSLVDNLDEFKESVITILALCQSPYTNEEIESKRIELWAHLTSETIQQMNHEYIQLVTGKNGSKSFSFYNIRQDPVISETPHEIYDFINQLRQQASDLCNFNAIEGESNNEYYCPIILENLMQLLIEFPSWTKIFVKKAEYSSLVSLSAVKHSSTLIELKEPISPPQFLMYHYDKLKSLMDQGRFTLNKLKNKIGYLEKEHKSNHLQTSQVNSLHDSRIEINILDNENIQNDENDIENQDVSMHILQNNSANEIGIESDVNLLDLKSAINTAIRSLLDFDEYVKNVLLPIMKKGQEIAICKVLLDCCTEMKTYDKFFGNIAERFCSAKESFSDAFRQIFVNCYKRVDLLEKHELNNISRLFAHLLAMDSISWNCLSVVQITGKDMSIPKKHFIKNLFQELSEHMGISNLENRFRDKEYKFAFKGLFPSNNKIDMITASAFFKSIGLKSLGDIAKGKPKISEPTILKRSPSVSSVASNDSCDYVFELRIKRKNGKKCSPTQKKVIVVK